jgi:hypothetical protein
MSRPSVSRVTAAPAVVADVPRLFEGVAPVEAVAVGRVEVDALAVGGAEEVTGAEVTPEVGAPDEGAVEVLAPDDEAAESGGTETDSVVDPLQALSAVRAIASITVTPPARTPPRVVALRARPHP